MDLHAQPMQHLIRELERTRVGLARRCFTGTCMACSRLRALSLPAAIVRPRASVSSLVFIRFLWYAISTYVFQFNKKSFYVR